MKIFLGVILLLAVAAIFAVYLSYRRAIGSAYRRIAAGA
jgi:hypothetical protein